MKRMLYLIIVCGCLGPVLAQPYDPDISADLAYLEDRLTTYAPEEDFASAFGFIDALLPGGVPQLVMTGAILDSLLWRMLAIPTIPRAELTELVSRLDQARKEVFFTLPPLEHFGLSAHFAGSIGPCTVLILSRGPGTVLFQPRDELWAPWGESIDLDVFSLGPGTIEWEFDTENETHTRGARAYFRNLALSQTEVEVTFRPVGSGDPCQARLRVFVEGAYYPEY